MGRSSKLARLKARHKLSRQRQKARRIRNTIMHACEICGKTDDKKPMAFRNMPWCSENHRKEIQGDPKRKTY